MSLWLENETDFLKQHYDKMPNVELSKNLNRTTNSVQRKASRMGLLKNSWIIENITLNDFEKGYLSAIIDGEGTVSISRQNQKGRNISFNNTSHELLEKIQQIVGGSIFDKPLSGLGKKPQFQIEINGAFRVYPILNQIISDLTVQRERAKIVLKFCEMRLSREKRNSPYTCEEIELIQKFRHKKGGRPK